MNTRAVVAVVRKDLTAVLRSRPVMIPMILVPVLMLVLLPALLIFAPQLVSLPGSNLDELTALLRRLPEGLRLGIEGLTPAQQVVRLGLVYLFAPLYLIVPIMVSSVVAADSFAGEKERGSLEALVYSPTTDRELFLAKVLGPWVAALAVGLGGFALYSLVGNLVSWLVLGQLLFPNWMWVALAFWLGPAVAGLGLGVTVLVSARVSTFQEAFQLGGVVVLPVLALLVGQVTGVMVFSLSLVLLLGLLFWLLDALLLWFGSRAFRRDELLSRL